MSKYIKLKDLTDTDCILIDEIECDDCPFYDKERFWCRMIDWTRSLPTIEVSEDCISKAYLEQEIENQAMTVEKDKEYWRGWNNALDKVVELIEDAPSVVPTTEQSSMVGECPYFIDGVWCNLVGKEMKG